MDTNFNIIYSYLFVFISGFYLALHFDFDYVEQTLRSAKEESKANLVRN